MRTAEEFKAQAEKHNITRAFMRPCSICGYEIGYHFRNGEVVFDHGCDCIRGGYRESESSWEAVAKMYNQQDNPDVIRQMDEYWKFNVN